MFELWSFVLESVRIREEFVWKNFETKRYKLWREIREFFLITEGIFKVSDFESTYLYEFL